jgi:hypothetical protein
MTWIWIHWHLCLPLPLQSDSRLSRTPQTASWRTSPTNVSSSR